MCLNSMSEVEGLMFGAYKQIVKMYLRYVLIRCAGFTNNKKHAEEIAVYTLLTTCALTPKLEHPWQLGWLLDCMTNEICRDITRETSQVKEDQRLAKSNMLLADKKMRNLAKAVNMLDDFTRRVLVFRHIEMMSTKEISLICGKTIYEISLELDRGARKLTENLAALWGKSVLSAEDACLWLSDLDDALNSEVQKQVVESVLTCLAESGKKITAKKRYFDFGNLN